MIGRSGLYGPATIVVAQLLASSISADAQDRYSEWASTPGAYKLGYISGYLDVFTNWNLPADPIGTAFGKAYRACLARSDIQPSALVEMIDLAYRANVHRRQLPAAIVLMCELQKQCIPEIQKELKAVGYHGEAPCRGYD